LGKRRHPVLLTFCGETLALLAGRMPDGLALHEPLLFLHLLDREIDCISPFYSEQPGTFFVGSEVRWIYTQFCTPRLTKLLCVWLSAPACSDERCIRSSSNREVEHSVSGVALGFVEAQT